MKKLLLIFVFLGLFIYVGPVFGATVNYYVSTTGSGAFTIDSIDPENYRVEVDKDGYFIKQVKKLDLADDVSGTIYQLTAAASFSGRATHQGEPVRGASIYAYGQKQNAQQDYASATTDDQGYYQINNLKKGTRTARPAAILTAITSSPA